MSGYNPESLEVSRARSQARLDEAWGMAAEGLKEIEELARVGPETARLSQMAIFCAHLVAAECHHRAGCEAMERAEGGNP